jgi:hypothetical protein
MDSKILILAVIGVAAIVIIAIVVVYQFLEQQYTIGKVREDIQKQAIEEKSNAYRQCILINTQQFCLDKYYK